MIHNALSLFRQGAIGVLVLTVAFIAIEPAVSLGATTVTSQFTVSQTVNAEISFATLASNVTMSPALGGVTGGTAAGATSVAVETNDVNGYNMTLAASSSLGMINNASSTAIIPAYVVATGTTSPDYNFTTPANGARFGYSVGASSTSDVAQAFANNGAVCNSPGGSTNSSAATYHCWLPASTTPIQIINRTTLTPSTGATTTIDFQVVISANPSPAIISGTYVATTTLTATAN